MYFNWNWDVFFLLSFRLIIVPSSSLRGRLSDIFNRDKKKSDTFRCGAHISLIFQTIWNFHLISSSMYVVQPYKSHCLLICLQSDFATFSPQPPQQQQQSSWKSRLHTDLLTWNHVTSCLSFRMRLKRKKNKFAYIYCNRNARISSYTLAFTVFFWCVP